MMLELNITKRTDTRLLERMKYHYSHPKGFVGRNICYAVIYDSVYYGHIIAGSATRFLPNRNKFLSINITELDNVINNIFFNISPANSKYPIRNFSALVVKEFVKRSSQDWYNKYGDICVGFETLVEKPRTGDVYLRAGWTLVGETKGYSCKRVSGESTDSYSGKRIWNTQYLRPKLVFCLSMERLAQCKKGE